MPSDTKSKPEIVVQGISASPGIAHGQIFVYLQSDVEVPNYQVEPGQRAGEIARLEKALVQTRQQISKIQSEVEKSLGPDEARIFDAHLLVLEDPALISETIKDVETTGHNVDHCFSEVAQRYIRAFSEIGDEFLRERAGDIRDVAQRVLQNLLGQDGSPFSHLAEHRIVVANDISPSDSASIHRSSALAIVTDSGSRTSHAVIVARSMRVPAVVGVRDLTKRVSPGDWAIVDGYDGIVIVNPSEATLFRYGKIQVRKKSFEQLLIEANRQPAVTLDGVPVELMANIERVDEIGLLKEYNAEGVGLYRTEYLYLNSSRIPAEQEQFLAYKAVVEAMAPHPVVIRTLDLGGDKPMSGNPDLFPKEANPFLGCRAIRFCLDHPDIFKDQLRAILLASASGKVRIMYPMISGEAELVKANAILASCKDELRSRGQAFDEKIEVGAMIEIPSAAATIDLLAGHCQFFSIGTNDLIQYLLAVERGNDRVAHLYEPTHPAVLRTLRQIVDEAHKHGTRVAVCGEMGGDPVYAPLLLGLGVDELSMTPSWLPPVKYLIRAMRMSDARALAAEALSMSSPREIYERCDAFYRTRVAVE
jgi:phosphoenolpyruvate-protein phosphotransferase (PTS system enzyme I)